MFTTFLDKIVPNRIAGKLMERLNDERRYNSKPPAPKGRPWAIVVEPLYRDLIDGNDFTSIDPKERR